MYDEMMKRQQKAKEAAEAEREKVAVWVCYQLERASRDRSGTSRSS